MSKNTILIVDDKAANRAALNEMFKNKYTILEAFDGIDAVTKIKEHKQELIMVLLDIKMPNMNGFNVLQEMKMMDLIGKVPVIMITAIEKEDFRSAGYNLGVSDYIIKPFEPIVVVRRVENVIRLFQNMNALEDTVVEQQQKLKEQSGQIRQFTEKMTDVLCTLIEYRNLESKNNVRQAKMLTRIMAEYIRDNYPEYNLNERYIDELVLASGLHDFGKICIPDSILLKPGKLSDSEYEVIKSHTTKGAEMIDQLDDLIDPDYKHIYYEVCRGHHERFDGKGYPDGLRGDDIPISAQIVGLVDVYEALVTDRVYKKSYTPEQAYAMIVGGECGSFSMVLISTLKRLRSEFERIVL